MVARTLPGLGLTGYWDLGADGWKDAMDTNLRVLSVIAGGLVKSRVTALPGSPAAGDIYIVPSGAGSHPNEIAVYDGPTGSLAWVYLIPKKGRLFYVEDESKTYQFDGSVWAVFSSGAGGSSGYDLRVGFGATPASSATLESIPIVRDVTLAANLAGSVGNIATNPTSSFVISIEDDGVEIGTITIGTGGTFTFATTSGTEKVVAAGSILSFIAPTTADATAANCVITVMGEA